ncbi:MAG TPA: Ig-like domain-containing protein [Acidobacteriaceae bacterium]
MKQKHSRLRINVTAVGFKVALLLYVTSASIIIGCKGFFIGPKLTTVTLAPSTPSVGVGKTQQMTATGTYDDSSTATITDSASWSSSDVATATVGSTGLVTGVASGSATISATFAAISGSTTVNVTVANLASISITPATQSIASGATQQYTAIGVLQNGNTVDLTSSVTWKSSNTAVATIVSSGLATAKTVTSTQTTNITAQSGSITGNTAVLTVTGTS